MGYLRAPHGDGKVIWIKAGASRESVRLGVELLGAIRGKRVDVRLALTFQNDYADILEPRVSGLREIGLGFGPCDLPRVVRRTLRRLQPFGLVIADAHPSPNLLAAAVARGSHVVAFNSGPTGVAVEAAYPHSQRQADAWEASGLARYLAPAADPLSLFAEAQVDATLKSLVGGAGELALWWWLGRRDQLHDFVAAWKASRLSSDGILFVSALDDPARSEGLPDVELKMSTWGRHGLDPGTVAWVDVARWRPAVSSAVTAAHCADLDRLHLWDSLMGGPALTASQSVIAEYPKLEPCAVACDDPSQTLAEWARFRAEPIHARQSGDRARRVVWEERREVQAVLQEFLQRVFDW